MKKLIMFAIILFSSFLLLVVTQTAYAQQDSMMGTDNVTEQAQPEGSMQVQSVETVLQDILKSQNVTTVQKLDLSKISDDNWEKLGDAVMEVQHPGKAHEVMDQMMGGEGSKSLRQIHINMGKAYLGYGDSNGYGMMGGFGGMLNGWNNQSTSASGYSMMGYGNAMCGGYRIIAGITWITVITFLISGTYFFIKQARKGRKKDK